MKIILGTKSEDKIRILVNNLKRFNIKDLLIMDISVDSGISDQPLSEDETILGARNRAFNAVKKYKEEAVGDYLGVGLEGGLCDIDNNLYLVCVSCLVDKNNNEYIGISSKISIPSIVSTGVKKGESFGVLIREYKKSYGDSFYIKELISREKSFSEAINNSLVVFFDKNNGEQSA